MSSSNSPCAACKFLRRKCTQECVFAPYFPPDNPAKFANVHKVFGASNVAKLLNDIPTPNREDAVNSLAYEAEARLRDPVYGCVGLISILQQRLKKIQIDLVNAKSELSAYIGSSTMLPIVYNNPAYAQQQQEQHFIINPSASSITMQYNNMPVPRVMDLMSSGVGPSNQQQHQQMIEAQQMAEVRENQELLRSYEHQLLIRQQMHQQQTHHHHSQNDFTVGFHSGFDSDDPSVPFLQINSPTGVPSTVIEANVNLGGGFDIDSTTSNPYHQQQENEMPHHHQQQNQLHTQHLLQSEQQLQLQQPLQNLNQQQHNHNNNQRSGSNEGRSLDPSS